MWHGGLLELLLDSFDGAGALVNQAKYIAKKEVKLIIIR